MGTWVISASEARFGKNTKITGRGSDGMKGDDSKRHGGDAPECRDGRHGTRGASGTNGVNINITMGLVSIGGLKIDVRSGNGGRASCGRVSCFN